MRADLLSWQYRGGLEIHYEQSFRDLSRNVPSDGALRVPESSRLRLEGGHPQCLEQAF